MQTPDGVVFEQIVEAVRASGKALSIELSVDEDGGVWHEVSNVDGEGVPLSGWEWGDREHHTRERGPTLGYAWAGWQAEAARLRAL